MSYILNALRKSELERHAGQPDSLENRILEKPENKKKKTSIWLLLLILINVFFLIFIVLSFIKEDEKVILEKITKIPPEEKFKQKDAIKEKVKKTPVSTIKTPKKQLQSSIAEQINQQQQQQQIKLKVAINKQAEIKPPIIQKKELDQLKIEPLLAKIAPNKRKTSVKIESKPDNDFPFLADLPHQFRRSVPELDINVYVYSENKTDRFIMIQMKKYVSGELMDMGVRLKEIRMNSLVLEYRNKIFQMKRN